MAQTVSAAGMLCIGMRMERVDFMRLWEALKSLLLFTLLTCTALAASFPDFPVRPARDCPVSAARPGLVIGAVPLDDVKQQELYFGAKLTPGGHLPVFIVIENTSAHSFILRKDAIVFQGSPTAAPQARSRAGEGAIAADASLQAAGAIGGTIAGVGAIGSPLPLGAIGNASISRAADVRHNLVKKELQSRTLAPGESSQGFLYIPVPKKAPRPQLHLTVPVTTPAGETVNVVLIL